MKCTCNKIDKNQGMKRILLRGLKSLSSVDKVTIGFWRGVPREILRQGTLEARMAHSLEDYEIHECYLIKDKKLK